MSVERKYDFISITHGLESEQKASEERRGDERHGWSTICQDRKSDMSGKRHGVDNSLS